MPMKQGKPSLLRVHLMVAHPGQARAYHVAKTGGDSHYGTLSQQANRQRRWLFGAGRAR
jgi:hypothetical protein